MIETIFNLPPSFILIIGSILLPFIPNKLRNILAVFLPVLALITIYKLPIGHISTVNFFNYDLVLLRVDKLSKAFAYIFSISAIAAFIYGQYEKKWPEFVSALFYIGSAIGVVFSGDLFTLYIYWEIMAVASTFLILANKTESSFNAAKRYILVHIFGGLVLLAGILITFNQTGSLAFNSFTEINLGTCLILIGFLVNAAGLPFSSWLPDAYPESTVLGGVILSAYTSKTAVYTLLRGFPGWEILIYIGCAMIIYGVIYGLLENNIRRVLAYSIVNQVGFMVIAAGVGSAFAIAGAVAHAFCHIIYKGLLWMTAGAVIHRTGKSKFTELGGLHKSMPITLTVGVVGALAMIAPLTSAYTTKSIIIKAVEHQHLVIPWLILEIGTVGVFLNGGLKFIYYIFFGKDRSIKASEAPKTMLISMTFLATLCIFFGIFPKPLYLILPSSDLVLSKMDTTFYEMYVHHFSHVVTKMQLIFFSLLAFLLFKKYIRLSDSVTLDIDWFYRNACKYFYMFMAWFLNGLNTICQSVVIDNLIANKLMRFARNAPALISSAVLTPIWSLLDISDAGKERNRNYIIESIQKGSFPIGYSAILTLVFLTVLIYIN